MGVSDLRGVSRALDRRGIGVDFQSRYVSKAKRVEQESSWAMGTWIRWRGKWGVELSFKFDSTCGDVGVAARPGEYGSHDSSYVLIDCYSSEIRQD